MRAVAQDDPRIRAVAQDYLSNEQTKLPLLPLSLDYENLDCSGNCCRRQSACVIGHRLHWCLGDKPKANPRDLHTAWANWQAMQQRQQQQRDNWASSAHCNVEVLPVNSEQCRESHSPTESEA